MTIFLSEQEVDELTGIGKGADGQSKHQLQAQWLLSNGFPVIVNARGRPILAKTFVDGTIKTPSKSNDSWEPNLA